VDHQAHAAHGQHLVLAGNSDDDARDSRRLVPRARSSSKRRNRLGTASGGGIRNGNRKSSAAVKGSAGMMLSNEITHGTGISRCVTQPGGNWSIMDKTCFDSQYFV
jgi:hypothetical protein